MVRKSGRRLLTVASVAILILWLGLFAGIEAMVKLITAGIFLAVLGVIICIEAVESKARRDKVRQEQAEEIARERMKILCNPNHDFTCAFYVGSPYLKCTANPTADCRCSEYQSINDFSKR